MKNINQQLGSSTTGLLTASFIYIGLLIYASYFAFNPTQDKPQDNPLAQTDTVVPASQIASFAVVTPLPSGIFNSETIAVNNTSKETQNQPAEANSSGPDNAMVSGIQAQDQIETLSVSANSSQKTNVDGSTQSSPMVQPYPAVYGDNDALAWTTDERFTGRFDNRHDYYAKQRGRGYGRGRGDMNGDGEFDFSMSFKSRARMDADSDWDSDFNTDLASYQSGYYYLDSSAYPYYRTYYQRY